ncbi:hypothetical protein OFM39_34870, partial [Escherichia coli]|nr:hypothetical protein [Escherichia coli]
VLWATAANLFISQGCISERPASVAPPGEISGTVPLILPGGGCALPGLQDPLTGSHSVGPRKRSAAGRWHQARYPWCCRAA